MLPEEQLRQQELLYVLLVLVLLLEPLQLLVE